MLPILNMGDKRILLAHGSGGKFSHQLIDELIIKNLGNPILNALDDSAVLNKRKLAFTTDSFVVEPLFFPGGDIGKLAVFGTVNDLSMVGAKPLSLSLSFIIEEGFPLNDLERIILSIKKACQVANVRVVTGDTKVVEKGKADKIFINTAGIGMIKKYLSARGVKPGDEIILSGNLGDHSIAILQARDNFNFKTKLKSDLAPLSELVEIILDSGMDIHCFRDPTRGGLATILNEVAQVSDLGIEIKEEKIPICEEVKGVCEMLGFDPLYLANEGKLVVFSNPKDAQQLLKLMRRHKYGRKASLIGEVTPSPKGKVLLKTRIGGKRILDLLSGEQLPRIC